MTSSNGKLFRATGSLCGESTGPRWISLTTASDAELWCFLGSAPWINGWVNNREAGDLRRQRAHYGVIVRVVQRLYRSYWLCITSIYINMTLMVWFFAMPFSILTLQHCLLRIKDEAMSLLLSVTLVIVRPLGDIHSYIFVANDVSFICTVVYCVLIRQETPFPILFWDTIADSILYPFRAHLQFTPHVMFPFSIIGSVGSQPKREDVTCVTSSLVG